ncbi:MAG: RNA polymerase sigma factor [Candidatus Krumholzibacteriota bacterium]|nr:RNA polymerase sigma factor [Candidatus Krumholzibacteriota bacterium]
MRDDIESQLAVEFQGGDRGSFKRLVETMTRPLIAMGYRYTRNWETARDICQDTWIKVYERIHQYDPARPFKTWVLTIHRNHCLSHLRKAAVRREISTAELDCRPADSPAGDSDPSEDLHRREFWPRLRKAMTGLTESQRRVFAHVELEQIDQEEAARVLGMKYSTLRTTLHQARKRLAGILLKLEDER